MEILLPTLVRFGNVSIRIYADDHNPPHFHIVSPEFQVLVRLSDHTIISGKARESDLWEAMAWARTNANYLHTVWEELNERG
jgi:Domain of unknown function (DUF4160)